MRSVYVTSDSLLRDLAAEHRGDLISYSSLNNRDFEMRSVRQQAPDSLDWPVRVPTSDPRLELDLWFELVGIGTFLDVEIAVVDRRGEEDVVFSQVVRLMSHMKSKTANLRHLVIPLGDYAGDQVTVRFRSRFLGGERSEVAVIWGDPKIREKIETSRPNVIFIGIDTLRRDRVQFYSSAIREGLTPEIEKIASDGVAFKAVSQAPWTLPSVTSVLSGLYPSFHRTGKQLLAADNSEEFDALKEKAAEGEIDPFFRKFGKGYYAFSRLPKKVTLLPELLADRAGYDTHFINTNPWLDRHSGINKRFQSSRYMTSDFDVLTHGKEWIRRNRDGLFFLYLHLFTVHEWTKVDDFEGLPLDQRRLGYDRSVVAEDQLVGEFISRLKALDLYDSSLIIVYSDHGTHMWDEGWGNMWGHGRLMSNIELYVPLVVKFPYSKYAGAKVDSDVRLSDIFMTTIEAAGVEPESVPRFPFLTSQSESLVHAIDGTRKVDHIISEGGLWWDDMSAIQNDRYRLVRHHGSDQFTMVDRSTDRLVGGRIDNELSKEKEGLASLLQSYLDLADANGVAYERMNLSPEDVEHLKTLGYLQ